jgi:hypothetical protein
MSGFGYSHKNDVGFVDGVLTLYSHFLGCVKLKTIKLVFVASPLGMQHNIRSKRKCLGWL